LDTPGAVLDVADQEGARNHERLAIESPSGPPSSQPDKSDIHSDEREEAARGEQRQDAPRTRPAPHQPRRSWQLQVSRDTASLPVIAGDPDLEIGRQPPVAPCS
jgi:hypothetical protein